MTGKEMLKNLLAGKKVSNGETEMYLDENEIKVVSIYDGKEYLWITKSYDNFKVVEEKFKAGMYFKDKHTNDLSYVVVETGETTLRLVDVHTFKSESYLNIYGKCLHQFPHLEKYHG